ncbi:alpha/beta fold hydrolase [Caballeronia sp. BR00000012568055]|uniref:alpha/beta fold hydrolase n=1 Tax=Caballeronia sp. BR00000012568055 TaxID=2918761 RepID=UPI0023F80A8E|nr:alpha/beta hydrolase [Caballeronia sp. BR00000012568055]
MQPTTLIRIAAVWFFACLTPTAFAEDLSFGPSQLCGLTATRADASPAAQQKIAQGRNGPIAYVRFGHGAPLLLITGYRATMSEWNAYFLGELARHHDVIVFENRGIGDSKAQPGRYGPDYGIRDMAADAADLIAALKLSRVDVVGWSMGGMIAQQLALDAPAKVESLTLITTAPPGPQAVPLTPQVQAVLSESGAGAFGKIMAVLFPANAVADATQCFVGDMFKPRGYPKASVPDAVAAQQNQAMSRWFADSSAADALRRSPVRALVISGANDDVLNDANGRYLEKLIPRARLITVDDAGHALMYQYPIELARHIDAFVRR